MESSPAHSENPFCARRVRPGAAPFLFPAGQNPETLVDRLAGCGWWGQIIGAHGSGKSALVAAMVPAIEQCGRSVALIELHDGQRRLPIGLRTVPGLDRTSVVIVDGYEQLSRWSRWGLRRFCRRHGCGLVVTAHRPAGLPELFRTAVDLSLAQRVVEQLLTGYPAAIAREEIALRMDRHQGDLRETLFDLYDLYEQRRPRP